MSLGRIVKTPVGIFVPDVVFTAPEKIARALRMTAESRPRMNALTRVEREAIEASARKTIKEATK